MKRTLIIAGGLLALLALLWFALTGGRLVPVTVINISPNPGTKDLPLDTSLTIHLNKPLPSNALTIETNPASSFAMEPVGQTNTFTFTLASPLTSQTNYQITLKSRYALRYAGQTQKTHHWSLATKSEDKQQAAGRLQGQLDDAFNQRYADYLAKKPLLKLLESTDNQPPNAEITYDETKDVYTVTIYPIINDQPTDAEYQTIISQAKQAVIDWLKSQHIDPQSLQLNWQF